MSAARIAAVARRRVRQPDLHQRDGVHDQMIAAPRWTAAQDVMILGTRGQYVALQRLADEFGLTTRILLARWHVLRAR